MSVFVEAVLPDSPEGKELSNSFAEWACEMEAESLRLVHTKRQQEAILAEFGDRAVGEQFLVVMKANYPERSFKFVEA